MRESGRTTLFVLVCIAVLCAAYGVGLGVRNLRMAGFKIDISMGGAAAEPADKSAPESEVKPKTAPKPPEALVTAQAEPTSEAEPIEEPPEERAEPQTGPAEPMDLSGKKKRSPDLPEEEKQDKMTQRRRNAEERGRGEARGGAGRAALQQLSEEDRADFRAKMEALTAQARAGEISEEEMRQARGELLQAYGINPQARGGRRPGGRQ